MPGYLDGLPPDADMRTVFEGVHGQVIDVVADFGDLEAAIGVGESRQAWPVPGLLVETVANSGRTGQPHRRTSVYADVGSAAHRLVAISGMHSAAYVPPKTFPSGVEGFVGADYEARLGGTYQLSRQSLRQDDPVEARLGNPDRVLPSDPFTTISAKSSQRLKYMGAEDRQHVHGVRRGILDGLEAVQMILEGTRAEDVLEMLGRLTTRS
jgi:hypothetical protein